MNTVWRQQASELPQMALRSLLVGVAPNNRSAFPLAFVHAYFDDSVSNSDDKRLHIAGYMNLFDKWDLFSAAWQECLNEKPAIKYFKMREACSLQGQFLGMDPEDRDEKVRRLAHIVRHFDPISFEYSLSTQDYEDLISEFCPRGLSPHFYGISGIMSVVARFLRDRGAKYPVKFIFDQQNGVDMDVAMLFDHIRYSLPRGTKRFLSSLPTFEDDKVFLPIQAADMLAWHVRREKEGANLDTEIIGLLRTEHVRSELPRESMKQWRDEFSKKPGLVGMQSKGEWQRVRREMAKLKKDGFIAPYGNRWKNFIGAVRDWIKDRRRKW